MKNKEISREELIERAFYRWSWVLCHLSEEGDEAHTRLGEWLIPDDYVEYGTSLHGGGRREHVVPLAVLRDWALQQFSEDRSEEKILEVAKVLRKNLIIVHINRDEMVRLDSIIGLKKKMPDGWRVEDERPYARLEEAGIVIKPRKV